MSDTPRTNTRVKQMIDNGQSPEGLEYFARQLERELNAANERIKRLEEALELVLKMRNDWLERQDDGYAGAYYAFVKHNDSEWEAIIKTKEVKP